MKTITSEELRKMKERREDFTLINVLPKESFNKNHIPGSINIPVAEDGFLDQVEKNVKQKNEKIVVYCANKECDASPKAAKKLEDAGYQNVLDFEGGLKSWEETNQPTRSLN